MSGTKESPNATGSMLHTNTDTHIALVKPWEAVVRGVGGVCVDAGSAARGSARDASAPLLRCLGHAGRGVGTCRS